MDKESGPYSSQIMGASAYNIHFEHSHSAVKSALSVWVLSISYKRDQNEISRDICEM